MSSWCCEKNIDRIKRNSGVYVLYANTKQLKYIGYSENLFKRLLTHEKTWGYVKVKYCSVPEAKKLEYKLIQKVKPKLNKRSKGIKLSSEHRIRLKKETFYTIKMAADFQKKRPADIIQDLIEKSEDAIIISSIKIAENIIRELYEN